MFLFIFLNLQCFSHYFPTSFVLFVSTTNVIHLFPVASFFVIPQILCTSSLFFAIRLSFGCRITVAFRRVRVHAPRASVAMPGVEFRCRQLPVRLIFH